MLNKLKTWGRTLIKSPLFYIVIFGIIIDLISKQIVMHNISTHDTITLIPNFLFITLTYNTGAIFGSAQNDVGAHIFLIVSRVLLAIGLPILYAYQGKKLSFGYKVCAAFIYAGCIGNLIDDLFYYQPSLHSTAVVDWIGFSFFPYIFNLADSYVTVAVFIIVIFIIIEEIKEIKIKNKEGAYSLTPEEYEKKQKEKNHEENNHH